MPVLGALERGLAVGRDALDLLLGLLGLRRRVLALHQRADLRQVGLGAVDGDRIFRLRRLRVGLGLLGLGVGLVLVGLRLLGLLLGVGRVLLGLVGRLLGVLEVLLGLREVRRRGPQLLLEILIGRLVGGAGRGCRLLALVDLALQGRDLLL